MPYDPSEVYLVVIGILALVLTLNRPLFPLLTEHSLVLLAVAGATLLPGVAAAVSTRRVLSRLERYPNQPGRGQAAMARGVLIVHVLLGLGHASILLTTGWLEICEREISFIRGWVLIPGLVTLVPFLLSTLLVWVALYPADRAVRQIAVEVFLFRGKPLRPVWSLLSYLVYNLRHQVLFILIPMLLILAAHDIVVRYQRLIEAWSGVDYAADVLVGVAALFVAVITPEILRHVWVTRRLPDGPLRDRLQMLAKALRLRCRDILVWKSGGMIVNAAVMGVVAPLRYVLITDGMLEQMNDTKIEAVFGHEAGHVKRHHIFFFLLFAFISGCAVTIFTVRTHPIMRADYEQYQLLAALFGILLAAKWGLLFGWISRRFERQADVFGVRTLALAGVPCSQPCALHAPATNPAPRGGDSLCSTAAHIFGDALNEVALLNGIRPEGFSWRHSSIASRSQFLQLLARDPLRTARFERRLLWIKIVIFSVAAVSGAWAAYELNIWSSLLQVLQRWRG